MTERKRPEGLWYDPDTGSIGFGNTYGEQSFNNRPINTVPYSESKFALPEDEDRRKKIIADFINSLNKKPR